MRVQCGTCHRRIWTRLWCHHERRKHGGYSAQAHIPHKEEAMNTALGIQLDPKAELLGVAACSEAEPQCTAVQRRGNGDIVLANHVGAQLVIPAGEVMATAALMLKTIETGS